MNWGKFKGKEATSQIVREVVEAIASPLSGNLERDLKSFVTQVLEYVAFRPFSSLVLTLRQELEVSGPVRGFYDHQRMWEATTYAVYFRVGDETSFRSRNIGDTATIEECLGQLDEWYQGVSSQIGPLWEVFVVKYVGSGGVYGRTRATLEIFQMPEPTFLVQRTPKQERAAELVSLAHDIVEANLRQDGLTREDIESGMYRRPCGCWIEDDCYCYG